jgi:hypothetical protein
LPRFPNRWDAAKRRQVGPEIHRPGFLCLTAVADAPISEGLLPSRMRRSRRALLSRPLPSDAARWC